MKGGLQALRNVINSELVEVFIPGGTTRTKIQLPDQQNLRNIHLMGIEVYDVAMIPISIVSSRALVPTALLRSIFLTFQAYNGDNFVWQTPVVAYSNLEPAAFGQQLSPRKFNGQRVNWPKSYIEIADLTTVPAAVDTVLLVEVFYRESKLKQEAQDAARFEKRS